MNDTSVLNRWRLVLGGYASGQLAFSGRATLENGISCMDLEDVLDFLYQREQGEDVRRGGLGESRLTAADWITRRGSRTAGAGYLRDDGAFDGPGGA